MSAAVNLDMEGSILAALLCDATGACWARLGPMLRPEHFYSTANQLVFGAIAERCNAKRPCDPVSVAGTLEMRGTLAAAGGRLYLAETLALTQPAHAHPELLAAELVELWRRRELKEEIDRLAVEMATDVLTHEQAKQRLRDHFKRVQLG